MIKKIVKRMGKVGITVTVLTLGAGVAFAAFLMTTPISSGNQVTAASPLLQITGNKISLAGLVPGQPASRPAGVSRFPRR